MDIFVKRYSLKKESGAAMLLFILALLVGFTALFFSVYSNNNLNTEKDIKTHNKLSEAKSAVLDYVSTNYTKLQTGDYGVLPCPDYSGAINTQGEEDIGCLSSRINAIGHLPWKTLGVSPFKDKAGQCFWYIVSGIPKEADPSSTQLGLIEIYAPDRQTMLTNPSDPAVAAIIAANQPLEYQNNRPGISDSSICEQSYNPTYYLDRTTLNTSPIINVNNAQLNGTLETKDQLITADKISHTTIPPYSANNPSPYNDQIIFITRNELLASIEKNNMTQTETQTNLQETTAQITFTDDMATFNIGSGTADVDITNNGSDSNINITVDTNNDSAHGGTDYQHTCRWYGDTYELENNTLRAYFDFALSVDTSVDSSQRCSGFTFTIKPGSSTNCGLNGANLGFAGMTGVGNQSFAVEYDINNSPSKNDPITYNHIAIVKRTNNLHDTSTNSPCPGEGCYGLGNGSQSDITWLEDGNTHSTRIEIHTGFPNDQCNPGDEDSGGNYILVESWVDCNGTTCTDFGKMDTDYDNGSNPPLVSSCFRIPPQMRGDPSTGGNGIRFGITAAIGGCTTIAPYTELNISNFGLTID